MTIEHYLLSFYLQTVLSLIVSVLCFIKFRDRTLQVRLIGFIFWTSFVANVVGNLMIKWEVTRPFTNTTYPVYMMVHLAILSKIYYDLFNQKARLHIITAGIFTSFALINLFFGQKILPNSYTYVFHSVIILVYCLLYFYDLVRREHSLLISKLPMFWFNSGLLIFHAGAFFLFSFQSYLINVLKNNMLVYWTFHNLLSCIEHFIFLTGLYFDLSQSRSKTVPV